MRSKYPTKVELEEVFELIDGQLWRKEYIRKDGRQQLRQVVNNNPNDGGNGYCQVRFKGRLIKYHTIVYILSLGDIPSGYVIDHIDGNKTNNTICNLRLVTVRENNQNLYIHRQGRLPGCTFYKRNGKWKSQITIKGRNYHLGYFDTELEAHQIYLKALKEAA